ncbi:MAG TPA: hypothetical protein VES40_18085 [Ilumatobacteraceae bacterium]|nr:hypothetical protein [Ilumatobacteraceae bacterium]
MIDVLALLRPAVDADLLLVRLLGGATHAVSIRQILADGDLSLRLDCGPDGSTRATLHSSASLVPSATITSLQAVTFAAFVAAPSMGAT